MSKLIIKGAIYTDGDTLLRPHYTGEFNMVDCTEYKTEDDIRSNYSEMTANEFINDNLYLEYNGVIYYECEYSPYSTDGLVLLSDLDDLEYYDNETSFN